MGRPFAYSLFSISAIEYNESTSFFSLSQILLAGFPGLQPQPEIGTKLLEALASDQHAGAQYLLGSRLMQRKETMLKGIDFLVKAAKNGHAHANLQMAHLHEQGLAESTSESTVFEYTKRAAETGNLIVKQLR